MHSTLKDSSAARVIEPHAASDLDPLSAGPKDGKSPPNELTSLTGGGGQHEFQSFLKRCERQMAETGFVTVWAAADAKARRPAYAYTVGLEDRFRVPELLLFGIDQDHALTAINTLVRRYMRKGISLPLDGLVRVDQMQLAVKAIPTERAFLYAHRAIEYCLYKQVRCAFQQLVRPDAKGHFPWERGYDVRMNRIQPQLFRP